MCYSAMVKQDFKQLKLGWKVRMDMDLILEMFQLRNQGDDVKFCKAFKANFTTSTTEQEFAIKTEIDTYRNTLIAELESDLLSKRSPRQGRRSIKNKSNEEK